MMDMAKLKLQYSTIISVNCATFTFKQLSDNLFLRKSAYFINKYIYTTAAFVTGNAYFISICQVSLPGLNFKIRHGVKIGNIVTF